MPHDCGGNELHVGDVVLVRCTVASVSAGTDYCNVTLETVRPCHPGEYKTCISLNAWQVEKSDPEKE